MLTAWAPEARVPEMSPVMRRLLGGDEDQGAEVPTVVCRRTTCPLRAR